MTEDIRDELERRYRNLRERALGQEKELGGSREEIYKFGSDALNAGETYYPLIAFKQLDDHEKLKEVGELALRKHSIDAHYAFKHINDREGMLRIIQSYPSSSGRDVPFGDYLLNGVLRDYMGDDLLKQVTNRFKEWHKERGYEKAHTFHIEPINMIYNLKDEFDLAVGTAKSGLYGAFLFDLYGTPAIAVDAHRHGNGATFHSNEDLSKLIPGRKVVVCDKDVVSGRTSRRVLRELKKYDPESVSLVLNNNPNRGPVGIGTNVERIPFGYETVYFPKDFSLEKYDEVVRTLEEKILGVENE